MRSLSKFKTLASLRLSSSNLSWRFPPYPRAHAATLRAQRSGPLALRLLDKMRMIEDAGGDLSRRYPILWSLVSVAPNLRQREAEEIVFIIISWKLTLTAGRDPLPRQLLRRSLDGGLLLGNLAAVADVRRGTSADLPSPCNEAGR